MRQTYITTLPDEAGAFLRAARRFAELGLNITRVSFNKAVDTHTLFIEADGTAGQLAAAREALAAIGFLQSEGGGCAVLLIEFHLPDVPGSVAKVLELIRDEGFNISYISSRVNGTGFQDFKMGLLIDDHGKLESFLGRVSRLCSYRVINYDHTEKNFDNSVFYSSFCSELADTVGLGEEDRRELLVNIDLAMQTLDEYNLPPYRTFDCISRFAKLLAGCRGSAFQPRITDYPFGRDAGVTVIEPPCGSNTMILRSGGAYLFIDTGYACYREETRGVLETLVPGFGAMEKTAFLTHADPDHCGLADLFDTVYLSEKSRTSLVRERETGAGFREQQETHVPYIRICKLLTAYQPPDPDRLRARWGTDAPLSQPLERVGEFSFGRFDFDVYEGAGGHLPGELLLLDYEHKIAFTGDVYINLKGLTPEQAEFNKYAPILMTSVDTDARLAGEERAALMGLLDCGTWQLFGSHGLPRSVPAPCAVK